MKKMITTIATTGLLAGAAVGMSGTASAAPGKADHVTTRTVLEGKMSGRMGNQHRLVIQTDTEGMQYPERASYVTSYYCPSGYRITSSWTSKRCIQRAKTYLDVARSDYRVSSTMRSAVVDGTATGGGKAYRMDLTLRSKALEPITTDHGAPGVTLAVQEAKIYGSVAGATVRLDAREPSFIHRWVYG